MTTPISDLACDRLAAWYSTRATFAVMGEFSSGKSTLLNLLLGEAVLPMQATATSLPPVWFTSSGTGSAGCEALMRDGRMVETDIAAAATSQDPDLLMLRIAHDAPLLDRIDLIDTPGISDPRMAADTLDFIKPFVDFAVWCSAAEQAWRATEAKFWKGCPKHLHASSLLCVTRIDQIAREKDVGRILNRARREAKGLFGEVLGLATLRAIEARRDGEDDLWSSAGGATFTAALDERISAAGERAAARPNVADPMGEASPVLPGPGASTASETAIFLAAPPRPTAMADDPAESIRNLAREALKSSRNDPSAEAVRHIFLTFQDYQDLSKDHRAVIERILRPARCDEIDWKQAIPQIARELEDFCGGPLHRVSPPPP